MSRQRAEASRGSRMRWSRLLWLVPPALAIAAVVWLHYETPVTAHTLHRSVSDAVGSGLPLGTCRPRGGGVWLCDVLDSEGSGGSRYRVRVSGRCWTARRGVDGGERPMPLRVHGCVGLIDRLAL